MDFFDYDNDLDDKVIPRDDDENDILRVYRSLDRRKKHEFMSMVYRFDEEQ